MKKILLFFLLIISFNAISQDIRTPLQANSYEKITSYSELTDFIQNLDLSSDILNVEVIGKSVEGRNLYAMKFSSSEFGNDSSKIKVLILAQQHGNEQAGKEGALLLALKLLQPENQYLFNRIDLVIIPQMNPDGSEVNQRRNGNYTDLNRNHLILTEPETIALHKLFNKYLFQVTLDAHEYFPYGETWKNFGYRSNSDLLLGISTNINVSEDIRYMSANSFIPFMKNFLDDRDISNFIYTPGGPPGIRYFRQSTFDINDGRQSFGIQNSFSFIQEGMNGTDGLIDNIKHRTQSQAAGMKGLLEYTYLNSDLMKSTVANDRKGIIHENLGQAISIQLEHVKNGDTLKLPVYSYSTGNDSIIKALDYRGIVSALHEVKKPLGYLVPKNLVEIVDWLNRKEIEYADYSLSLSHSIEQYEISAIDSMDFEGDIIVNPEVITKGINSQFNHTDYVFVSTEQLKGNMLVIALEPKSELGLITYSLYAHLLKEGEEFPILRVLKK